MNSKSIALATQTIGFIGAGNMAGAIAKGLVKAGHNPDKIILSNPSQSKLIALNKELGVSTTPNNQEVCDQSQVVLLTIKPQMFPSVLPQLELSSVNYLVSVAAGITVANIESLSNNHPNIIRAMPNTPATELVGATGLFSKSRNKPQLTQLVDYIFGAVGDFVWIEDERLMNSVTAISGSAPAYFFLFVESLIAAGVAEGLSEENARSLVVQTSLGAATMMARQTQGSVADLRRAVTSPGGTTAAALASFSENQFSKIIQNAVRAAVIRGEELAGDS